MILSSFPLNLPRSLFSPSGFLQLHSPMPLPLPPTKQTLPPHLSLNTAINAFLVLTQPKPVSYQLVPSIESITHTIVTRATTFNDTLPSAINHPFNGHPPSTNPKLHPPTSHHPQTTSHFTHPRSPSVSISRAQQSNNKRPTFFLVSRSGGRFSRSSSPRNSVSNWRKPRVFSAGRNPGEIGLCLSPTKPQLPMPTPPSRVPNAESPITNAALYHHRRRLLLPPSPPLPRTASCSRRGS